MSCGPIQTTIQTTSCTTEQSQVPSQTTMADKNRSFLEEASFFVSHFKNFTVRPMPDPSLMLLLQRGKWRQKLRKVNKKEKTSRLLMRNHKKDEEAHDNLYESS